MSRILAIALTSVALLSAPAYAQQVSLSKAECQQAVEDVRELFKTESTDEGTEATIHDILKTSEDHCAQANFGQADEILRGARIMLGTE